ncbi:MAG TPA: hypothetical protein DEO82_00815 [Eubacterium sp.]|nr:hypothetical protein [Eubacterium sp.]
MKNMYEMYGIDAKIEEFGKSVLQSIEGRLKNIDDIGEYNHLKVIAAMQKHRLSDSHFFATTGYGYNDLGRDTIEAVYAEVFGAEDALVRPQLMSGTHALTVALFGLLRPGDELFSPVGKPYDTLDEVIGIRDAAGSLKDFGVSFNYVDMLPDGSFDYDNIAKAINSKTKVITIQRSKGYEARKSLSVAEIGELVAFVKKIKPDVIVMVDNCYGEFVEKTEPTQVGADLCVGSLIKNPGGGLVPTGGYIVGKKEYVEMCANRLTAPGLGKEIGATLGINQMLFQGLFLSPIVVANAVKGAVYVSACYERLGFDTLPGSCEERHDIIQLVKLNNTRNLELFCQGIQAAAPVDSFVVPEISPMPGYDSDIIMAAGTFVQGSSIELSADGPAREPYYVFYQGGLTFGHAKLGALMSIQKLYEEGRVRVM